MRIKALLFILLVFAEAAFAQEVSESFEQAQKSGKATLYLHYFEVPFFVVKKNGILEGINVDILNDFIAYAKNKKGIDITLKTDDKGSDFKAMYDRVKKSSGLVIGVGAIAGTDERKKEIGVTRAYISFYNVLVSHNNVAELKNWNDFQTTFRGMTGYAMKGSKMEEELGQLRDKYYPSLTITSFSSLKEYNDRLINDDKGMGYMMFPNYLEALRGGKKVKRHAIADSEALPICFVFPKDSNWVNIFNEFLSADGGYVNTSRYRSILLKHMGETGLKLLKMK